MKKFLTFVLVLAMVMSVSSFAMAAELPAVVGGKITLGNDTYTLSADVTLAAGQYIEVPAGVTAVLDLNGFTITGTDNNTSGNFYLIDVNKGKLTIQDSSAAGTGKITLTATNERNWSSSSVVVANNQGTLEVKSGTIEHLGGTSMAYGIDNLTNGNIGDAITTISGGTVNSTYFAIRQFANSNSKMNKLVITGGDIGYVWMQSPNSNTNSVATEITSGEVDGLCGTGVNADWKLSAAEGSVGTVYGTMPNGKVATVKDGKFVLTDNADEYSVTVSPAELDFGTKEAGYTNVTEQSVTVTNSSGKQVKITPNASSKYDITPAEVVLADDETATLTVKPKSGLGAAKHDDDLYVNIIVDPNGSPNPAALAISVKFTVNPAAAVIPTTNPSSGSGISVKYNGGNSFSTSNPAVPTGVEIDGVPVTFNGTGSNFTVGCISSDAKWVTVRWNSTSVTTNFTPDALVECTTVSIPKTGDMSFWAAVAAFFGF